MLAGEQHPDDALTTVEVATGVVVLGGTLDVSRIRELRATLIEALDSEDDVRVDVSTLRTLDSTAIRELLRAQAIAARSGKHFGLTGATANVRRLLVASDAAGLLRKEPDLA